MEKRIPTRDKTDILIHGKTKKKSSKNSQCVEKKSLKENFYFVKAQFHKRHFFNFHTFMLHKSRTKHQTMRMLFRKEFGPIV